MERSRDALLKFHFFRYTPSFTVRLHYLYLSAFSLLCPPHTLSLASVCCHQLLITCSPNRSLALAMPAAADVTTTTVASDRQLSPIGMLSPVTSVKLTHRVLVTGKHKSEKSTNVRHSAAQWPRNKRTRHEENV